MWRHGNVNVNGQVLATSWKVVDGAVKAIDLPKGSAPDLDIRIDGQQYVRENMGAEEYPDRITVPLISRAEMDRRIKVIEDEKAKALADFEGRPWPPEAQTENAIGKSRKG